MQQVRWFVRVLDSGGARIIFCGGLGPFPPLFPFFSPFLSPFPFFSCPLTYPPSPLPLPFPAP